MTTRLDNLIGKTMDETRDADWLQHWPVIDENGVILDIVDGDSIPDDATLVDWRDGKPVEVDGSYGFDAILEK